MGILENITDFLSKEAGQRRTQALNEGLAYYVPPELRQKLGLLAEMTPTATAQRAGQAGERMMAPDRTAAQRVGDLGAMLSETAGVVAPAMVANRVAMPVAQAVQEGLLGFSMGAGDMGRRFVERMNQPGPVPTMNAILPSMASLDEVFDFINKNKAIYHSGPANMAEDMQRWGVEPSYGPWVREIAAGAVDDVDEFLDQVPPAAWWSDQPDWIKMKVARAAKKPVSDVTVDDIRKHGHLAIASADDYSDVAFRIGDEGLDNGEYSFVEDLAGNRMRLYETPLYSEGNYPFGIERNEIVTGEAIEPAYSLTGDDLVKFMQRQGLLGDPVAALPTPRNDAEAMAKQVLEMRAAGRAGDVTEQMMAAADPQYMFFNTPLPMDYESRMARAAGRRDEFHGTTTGSGMTYADAFRGSGSRQGIGFVTSDNPYVSSSYADPAFGSVFPMLNEPPPVDAPRLDMGGKIWSQIPEDLPVQVGDRVITARDVAVDPADVGGVFDTNQLSRGASFDYPAIEFSNISDRSIHAPRPRTDDGMAVMREFQAKGAEPSTVTMRHDTRGMRSRFARFDPEFRHLRNLSAGVGGLGLLSYGYPSEEY